MNHAQKTKEEAVVKRRMWLAGWVAAEGTENCLWNMTVETGLGTWVRGLPGVIA